MNKLTAFIFSFVSTFGTAAGLETITTPAAPLQQTTENPTIYIISTLTGLISTIVLEYFRDWMIRRRNKKNVYKIKP